ncbi:hypothetical protein L6V77_31980 [Myxococcota bacterium]|nr:hypothetical protein [Myxococcota bacterium]
MRSSRVRHLPIVPPVGLAVIASLAVPSAAQADSAPPAPVSAAAPAPAAAPTASSRAGQIAVCVDVQMKSWKAPPPAPAQPPAAPPMAEAPMAAPPTDPPVPSADAPTVAAPSATLEGPPPRRPRPAPTLPAAPTDDPFAVQPERFLQRMVEYEVTHEIGFEAVTSGCRERLTVEMYPLPDGWTVFARYSGTAREEKVDRVHGDELAALAQRLTDALLYDRSIAETINRQTVLRADSEARMRMIDGRGYFTLALGTSLRVASLPTASGTSAPVSEDWRLLTPLDVQLGYRGKYQAWGLEAFARGLIGLNERAARRNDLGGHADFSKGLQAGLHFLRYLTPDGMNSTYLGGGASFELSSYDVILPAGDRGSDDREGLLTGGLNADLVIGYEFMRASAVHFFTQLDVQLPTYVIDTENDAGGIETYAPGAALQIGIVF